MSNQDRDREYSQPLLHGRRSDDVLFSTEDDDTYEHSALQRRDGNTASVETPQFGPPLRSTLQSREAGRIMIHNERHELALS
jgi:hypothetical protein